LLVGDRIVWRWLARVRHQTQTSAMSPDQAQVRRFRFRPRQARRRSETAGLKGRQGVRNFVRPAVSRGGAEPGRRGADRGRGGAATLAGLGRQAERYLQLSDVYRWLPDPGALGRSRSRRNDPLLDMFAVRTLHVPGRHESDERSRLEEVACSACRARRLRG
jgi:hypothetical protein